MSLDKDEACAKSFLNILQMARIALKQQLNAGVTRDGRQQICETDTFVFYELSMPIKDENHTGFGVFSKTHNAYGYWLKRKGMQSTSIRFFKSNASFLEAIEL